MLGAFDEKLDAAFPAYDRALLVSHLKAALPADGLLSAPRGAAGL